MDWHSSRRRQAVAARRVFCLACTGLLISGVAVLGEAQAPPAAVVRYTQAREHNLRRMLTLPGTVEAETTSTVASTIEGRVVEFPAKEGARVREGQPLAQLDTTTIALQLTSQQAQLREAGARLKLATSNLARAKELFAAQVVSRQQYDDAQSEYNAWLGRTDTLKAEIARVEDAIDRCTIRAPFAGVVVNERTEVGQWVVQGGPVVDLLAIDRVEIRVDVPERYFAAIRPGSAATASFESLGGLRVEGRVIALIPRADPQARTFPAKVRVPNRSGRIGAGMLAQVSFPAGETFAATIIPKDAVVRQGNRTVVYRVNGDNTVEEIAIETGAGAGAWIEVRGTIRPGDKVVTRGNERLRAGQPVQGTPIEYERP